MIMEAKSPNNFTSDVPMLWKCLTSSVQHKLYYFQECTCLMDRQSGGLGSGLEREEPQRMEGGEENLEGEEVVDAGRLNRKRGRRGVKEEVWIGRTGGRG